MTSQSVGPEEQDTRKKVTLLHLPSHESLLTPDRRDPGRPGEGCPRRVERGESGVREGVDKERELCRGRGNLGVPGKQRKKRTEVKGKDFSLSP